MPSKIKIGLVQINNSFSNQDYLPYSIGLLQGFIQKILTITIALNFFCQFIKGFP